jgi:hypothetical protein
MSGVAPPLMDAELPLTGPPWSDKVA